MLNPLSYLGFMQENVRLMPLNRPISRLRAAEKKRTSGIHLVQPAAQAAETTSQKPRKRVSLDWNERTSTLALAGAALIGPGIWVGHALLVRLTVL